MSKYRTISVPRVALMFRALSNPKRLALFQKLAGACGPGACCCTDQELSLGVDELARQLGLATSTISHHLKELRAAGLIRMARRGKFNEFQLDPGVLDALAGFLGCCGTPRSARVGPKRSGTRSTRHD